MCSRDSGTLPDPGASSYAFTNPPRDSAQNSSVGVRRSFEKRVATAQLVPIFETYLAEARCVREYASWVLAKGDENDG